MAQRVIMPFDVVVMQRYDLWQGAKEKGIQRRCQQGNGNGLDVLQRR